MNENSLPIVPLLVQSSIAYKQEHIQYSKARCQFVSYVIWNVFRYFIIGILIIFANRLNIKDTKDYVQYCCSCWFVSESPDTYSEKLKDKTRFDLSYCIPECVDCNYCRNNYANVKEAYNQISVCPMEGYIEPNGIVRLRPDWNEVLGCDDNISLTTMTHILKSYTAYSWASGIACLAYIIVLCILVYIERKHISNLYTEFLKWIVIYNIILSEICLYALFKPFQYWTDEIEIDEGSIIKCKIDSINDNIKFIYDYMVVGAIAFVFIHLVILLLHCLSFGCCCCCRNNEIIDDNTSDVTVTHVELRRNFWIRCCDGIHKIHWFISWCIIFPFMTVSAGCILYAIGAMIQADIHTTASLPWYYFGIIGTVVVLAVLSMFDLVVWWCFCYNNALGLKKKTLCVCTSDC